MGVKAPRLPRLSGRNQTTYDASKSGQRQFVFSRKTPVGRVGGKFKKWRNEVPQPNYNFSDEPIC
jgi:hypothetical protein